MPMPEGHPEGYRDQERSKTSAEVGGGSLVREKRKLLMTFELCLITVQSLGAGLVVEEGFPRSRHCFYRSTELPCLSLTIWKRTLSPGCPAAEGREQELQARSATKARLFIPDQGKHCRHGVRGGQAPLFNLC